MEREGKVPPNSVNIENFITRRFIIDSLVKPNFTIAYLFAPARIKIFEVDCMHTTKFFIRITIHMVLQIIKNTLADL